MTGKLRQYKAQMCLVAQARGTQQTLLVDDHVLLWYKNGLYRANQFAAAYAVVGDRFEVLSDASATDQVACLQRYILQHVEHILRSLTEATHSRGGSRAIPETIQPDPNHTRSTRPGYGSHQGPTHGYSQQEWNVFYNQWSEQEWEDWRRRRQGHRTAIGVGIFRDIVEITRSGSSRLFLQ